MIPPYGSWPSPITAESLTAGAIGLGDSAFCGDDLYWLQADPSDGGRVSLWRRRSEQSGEQNREQIDPQIEEVTPAPFNVRSRVHEYGGGAFAVGGGLVVFSHFADNRLYLITEDDPRPRPLTADSALRYAAVELHPDRDLIIAVRQDHRTDDHEPTNTVIARRISDGPEVPDRVLAAGADFYAAPTLSADGRLAWVEWRHPNMPWDSTILQVAELPVRPDGSVALDPRDADPLPARTVAGGEGESVAVPGWHPDGSLIFVSDRTDWWNLYRIDPAGGDPIALYETDAEFAPPQWTLGSRPYVIIDADRIVCSFNRGNRWQLGLLTIGTSISTSELVPYEIGLVSIGSLAGHGDTVSCRVGYPDRPSELITVDVTSGEVQTVRRSSQARIPEGLIATAVAVEWDSELGPVHGWYYPPTNDHVTGQVTGQGDQQVPPDGELPPMITVSHGGPTGGSTPDYDPEVLFWTSRGIAVLDVNYGGSVGYGRRYRERLLGRWGEVDVADCAAGALAMVEQGRADRRRLAIRGGSAGGYTTLRALTATDVFTAGISLYGIGDLTALATDTHKFESRYLDSLVGAYPAEAELYRERSPIHHVDDLDAPILLLQGADDKVVPPNQAEAFAAAARAKGLPVAMIIYPGEGHGFRRAENIVHAQQAELAFLGRVFGFTPADRLPELEIDNLDPASA